ncbi:MAG: DUF2147 domain-containing protein, partial [Pseudomonadota bacterium]
RPNLTTGIFASAIAIHVPDHLAPDRDKVYKSKMSLSGNALKVSGCVAVICRSQNWVRVK